MKPRLRGSPASVADKLAAAQLVDLGLTDYAAAYDIQVRLVARRKTGRPADDVFLMTEHYPVFTLGRRGGRENLVVSEGFLKAQGVDLVQIERGGYITYHGPGQLVLYPIVHLREAHMSVASYVDRLEELMIRLAADAGVSAARDERNHGVWVAGKKLGSIGIAIRHGVSFHGLALNVINSLEPFSWVNPCGLTGVRMTSLQEQTGQKLDLTTVRDGLPKHLATVFGRECNEVTREDLDVSLR